MIRILELISLLGEATSDEIKKFSSSVSYAEKMITSMKKESYIKNLKNENKSTFRLTQKGKKYRADNLPEILDESFLGQTLQTPQTLSENNSGICTSVEIKNRIPNHKKDIDSRALGILVSFGRIYGVHYTLEGECNRFHNKDY